MATPADLAKFDAYLVDKLQYDLAGAKKKFGGAKLAGGDPATAGLAKVSAAAPVPGNAPTVDEVTTSPEFIAAIQKAALMIVQGPAEHASDHANDMYRASVGYAAGHWSDVITDEIKKAADEQKEFEEAVSSIVEVGLIFIAPELKITGEILSGLVSPKSDQVAKAAIDVATKQKLDASAAKAVGDGALSFLQKHFSPEIATEFIKNQATAKVKNAIKLTVSSKDPAKCVKDFGEYLTRLADQHNAEIKGELDSLEKCVAVHTALEPTTIATYDPIVAKLFKDFHAEVLPAIKDKAEGVTRGVLRYGEADEGWSVTRVKKIFNLSNAPKDAKGQEQLYVEVDEYTRQLSGVEKLGDLVSGAKRGNFVVTYKILQFFTPDMYEEVKDMAEPMDYKYVAENIEKGVDSDT